MQKAMVILAAASISVLAFAEQHTVRQEEVHVHGAALLNVVLDQQQLAIELESPAFNIVGFEHKPSSAEQEQAIHTAEATLQDAMRLFALPSDAGCQLAKVDVEWSLADDHDEEHEQPSTKQKDEHAEDTHSEFHVQYAFQCTAPDRVDGIDVLLFQHFPNMQEIEAQVIGPNGQTALELTPNASRINLGS